jgi:hypothetical protein
LIGQRLGIVYVVASSRWLRITAAVMVARNRSHIPTENFPTYTKPKRERHAA